MKNLNLKIFLSLGFLLIGGSGCTRLIFPRQLADTNFEIRLAERMPGTYNISGATNLPEGSKVAVAAVRYVYPDDRNSQNRITKPTYSILDYQLAEVKQGKWQTSLKLLKPSATDELQEVWQFEQARLGLSFKPEKDVVFLATLAPTTLGDQLQGLEQRLAQRHLKIDKKLIYTTTTGERYVQVSHTQEIPPPATNKVASKSPSGTEINGGWGDRYLMPPEPLPPYRLEPSGDRKTNAPMKQEEFLK
jgi:hypothetical protein